MAQKIREPSREKYRHQMDEQGQLPLGFYQVLLCKRGQKPIPTPYIGDKQNLSEMEDFVTDYNLRFSTEKGLRFLQVRYVDARKAREETLGLMEKLRTTSAPPSP